MFYYSTFSSLLLFFLGIFVSVNISFPLVWKYRDRQLSAPKSFAVSPGPSEVVLPNISTL
jgi:Sec-independent protein secretion pathway component TatC